MKRQYGLILGSLFAVLTLFSFAKLNTKQESKIEKEVVLGKELAYAAVNLTKDSSDLNESNIEVDNELIKINNELLALEEEVEVVHDETVASYYHDKFNGRKTASGTVFNNSDYTAAHKTLPFGTVVRVTNLINEESIVVTITDRGPFIKGRQIDLSKQAFIDLTKDINKGVVKVKIEILPQDYLEKKSELQEELEAIAVLPENFDLNEFAL